MFAAYLDHFDQTYVKEITITGGFCILLRYNLTSISWLQETADSIICD